MEQLRSKMQYQELYSPFGVMIPSPMVAEVLENKHGVINPVIDLNVHSLTIVPTNGVVDITSGLIDNSNTTFGFSEKPEVVIVNGDTYRENHGWTWTGSEVVLDAPVGTGGDIFGLGLATVIGVTVPTGTVDASNVTFVFPLAPVLVVVNGKTYRSGHGWSGTTTVTLDAPPGVGGDVFSIL